MSRSVIEFQSDTDQPGRDPRWSCRESVFAVSGEPGLIAQRKSSGLTAVVRETLWREILPAGLGDVDDRWILR